MNKKTLIVLVVIAAIGLCASAIWWLQQQQQALPPKLDLSIVDEAIVTEPQESQPAQISEQIPVTDMRHLTGNGIASTEVEAPAQQQAAKARATNTPEQVVIYDSESETKPRYTITQFDDQGKVIGELAVLDETIQSDGQVAVTLALKNGNTTEQIKAVPNAEQRGYAINLATWEYANINFEELVVMFERGDKLAGLQIGHIMLKQGKLPEAIPFLVEATKVSGFSRPLDMIANEYFNRSVTEYTAAWGRIAAGYSGFDDWGARITLSGEEMIAIEQLAQQLRKRYQLK